MRLQPSAADRAFADEFLAFATRSDGDGAHPLVAIHPGSGGERKNWPPERWRELGRALLGQPGPERPRVLLVGGEADTKTLALLRDAWTPLAGPGDLFVVENLPLPQVSALLARGRLFVGHDSGISHLAAAVGTPCVLLFGPTDPDIWAPPYPFVRVLRAGDESMPGLEPAAVRAAVIETLAAPRGS